MFHWPGTSRNGDRAGRECNVLRGGCESRADDGCLLVWFWQRNEVSSCCRSKGRRSLEIEGRRLEVGDEAQGKVSDDGGGDGGVSKTERAAVRSGAGNPTHTT